MKAFHFYFSREGYLSHLKFETLIIFIKKIILMWITNAQEKSFKNVIYCFFQSRTLKDFFFGFFFWFLFFKSISNAHLLELFYR
jgi:hypothetical protein